MQPDPLQQLRDVHLPADPSAWPLGLGWWLLMAVGLALLVWAAMYLWRAYQQRRPIRQAGKLLAQLHARYQNGELNDLAYAHACNKVLKRLLVRGLGESQYAAMSGATWLASLDAISGSEFFAQGEGQLLGDMRFHAHAEVDANALHDGLLQLLRKVSSGVRP